MKKIFYLLGLFLLFIPFKVNALGNSYSVLVNELPFSMSNSFQAWDYNTRGGVGVYTTPSSAKIGSFSYNTTSSKDYVLSFSTSENFVPGYVYSISVLFSNSGLYTTTNPEPTKKYNITNPCDFLSVGYSYNFFSNYDGAKILACSQADFERIMLTTQYETSSAPDGMHDWLVDNQIFTFTFVANELPVTESQYNTISIRFKGNAEFIGYYISSLGYYSTVTDATLSQQITDVETSINNNIDIMKEKQDETNNLIGGESENTEDSKCGVICKLKGIFTGIIELPGKLVSLLIDALKSLFVPTDEQLYEIINDSKDLAENFGFVGESMNFFITIFTSLLGMVNANGCVEFPEFTIGATSLTPSITFWTAHNVCLNDNPILSSNITTIRTITSIVLVALFINFAVSKFFSILNKNDSGTTYDIASDGTATITDWTRTNGDMTRVRR